MFMVLGAALFVALVASSVLGLIMLLTGAGLVFSSRWRGWGSAILGGGVLGAGLSCVGIAVINWLFSSGPIPSEVWLLFCAAGFGWGGLAAGGALVLLAWLKLPNRWSDRRRANA